jgi:hypothetical protein
MATKRFVVELDREEVGQALRSGLASNTITELLLSCCDRGEISTEDVTRCMTEKASCFVLDNRGGVTASVLRVDDGKIGAAQVTFAWIGG